jgi:hypothetical protein
MMQAHVFSERVAPFRFALRKVPGPNLRHADL